MPKEAGGVAADVPPMTMTAMAQAHDRGGRDAPVSSARHMPAMQHAPALVPLAV